MRTHKVLRLKWKAWVQMFTKIDVRSLALMSVPIIRGGSRMLDGNRYQGIKKFCIAIDNLIYLKVSREEKIKV